MSIEVSILENGLRIATDTLKSVETVFLGAWVDVGASYESARENGISHLLEHMAFKGTKDRSAREIVETIENVGGYLNAYTSREVTAYHVRLLKENAKLGVDLLADILLNSHFPEEELEKEKLVVLQEIGQSYDTPDDIIFDYFQEVAFPNQSAGRPILGSPQTVKSFTRDSLFNYLKTHYIPERMIFAAAGNIEHQDFVKYVKENFEKREKIKYQKNIEKSLYKGGFLQEIRPLEQLHCVIGFEGLSSKDPELYTLSVLSAILGGGMSSRLFQEVREKLGLAYSIYSFSSPLRDAGLFGIYAGTSDKDLLALLTAIGRQLTSLTETLSETELSRAKAQLKSSVLMSLESPSARCERLVHQLRLFERPLLTEEVIEKIEAVNKESIRHLTEKFLKSPLTATLLGPLQRKVTLEEIQTMLFS